MYTSNKIIRLHLVNGRHIDIKLHPYRLPNSGEVCYDSPEDIIKEALDRGAFITTRDGISSSKLQHHVGDVQYYLSSIIQSEILEDAPVRDDYGS